MHAREAHADRQRQRRDSCDGNENELEQASTPPQRPPRANPEKLSERYSCVKVLGRGSFGEALHVQRRTDRKDFVMKKIDLVGMPEKERKAARLEVDVLKKFKHPNIVAFVESGVENDREAGRLRRGAPRLLIVMEFANGGDLSTLIAKQKKKRKPFEEDRIMRIMIQAMLALGYMHKQHVMHRDIKAANVFLHNSGTEMDIVKLGDFGIAKVLDSTMAKAKTVAGTPYYMSPEICKDQAYTLKSDVWSLGILFFELALLDVPFNANNLLGLVQKVVNQAPKRIPNHYSKEFRELGMSMLQKNPLRRPDIKYVLKKPFLKHHMTHLFKEVMDKSKKAVSKNVQTPRDLKSRMEKIANDVENMKEELRMKKATPGSDAAPRMYTKPDEPAELQKFLNEAAREKDKAEQRERRAQEVAIERRKLRREEEQKRRQKEREQREAEEEAESRKRQARKDEMARKRKEVRMKRERERKQIARDRASKPPVERPAWNNNWHKDDDVEVLVNGSPMINSFGELSVGDGGAEKDEEDKNDPRLRYLEMGTAAFVPGPVLSNPNPFAINGEYADKTGSNVADHYDSMSDEDGTTEITFVADESVKMPANEYGSDEMCVAKPPPGLNVQPIIEAGAIRNPPEQPFHVVPGQFRAFDEQHQRPFRSSPMLQSNANEMGQQRGGYVRRPQGDHDEANSARYQDNFSHQQDSRTQDTNLALRQNLNPTPIYYSQDHQYRFQQHQQQKAQNQQKKDGSGWTSNQPQYGNAYGYAHPQQAPAVPLDSRPQALVRQLSDSDRRRIFEENQEAMRRNKQRVENEKRRDHVTVSTPRNDYPQASYSSPDQIRQAKIQRKEEENAQHTEALELARREAYEGRMRLQRQKQLREDRERNKSIQPAGGDNRGEDRLSLRPGSRERGPIRTRAQILAEKQAKRDAEDKKRRQDLEKARIEAFEERKRLDQKHRNSVDVAVTSAEASTAAVTKALDMTTSIYIDDETDLFPISETMASSNEGVEEMIGLAESLKNILFPGNEASKNFFAHSSAAVPNHDLVRVSGKQRPVQIPMDEITGAIEEDLLRQSNDSSVQKAPMAGSFGPKPPTPLDQSFDSLAVLYRKRTGKSHADTNHGDVGTPLDMDYKLPKKKGAPRPNS